MKNLLKWLPCLIFAACSCLSCDTEGKIIDLSIHDETNLNLTTTIDLVKRKEGMYVGKVHSNNILTGDNKIVILESIQDTFIHLKADFLEYKYQENFRVDSVNNKCYLRNDALKEFSIYIEADSLFIDYTNNSQDAISYRGKKAKKDN